MVTEWDQLKPFSEFPFTATAPSHPTPPPCPPQPHPLSGSVPHLLQLANTWWNPYCFHVRRQILDGRTLLLVKDGQPVFVVEGAMSASGVPWVEAGSWERWAVVALGEGRSVEHPSWQWQYSSHMLCSVNYSHMGWAGGGDWPQPAVRETR